MSIWKAVHWQLEFWNEVIKFMKNGFYLRASVFLSWGTHPEIHLLLGLNVHMQMSAVRRACACPGTIKHLCITPCSNALVPESMVIGFVSQRRKSSAVYFFSPVLPWGCDHFHPASEVYFALLHKKLIKGENPIFISVISFHFFPFLDWVSNDYFFIFEFVK